MKTYKPNKAMMEQARQGLQWKKEGRSGGTIIGITRARQLLRRDNLSEKTVKRMYSFFKRHEVDKQSDGFYPGSSKYPSPGRVAWSLWGGDAGFKWSTEHRNKMEK